MPQDEETRKNKGLEIYQRLSKAWKMAALDREIGFKELVLAPIYDGFAPIGAAIFLSVLCYPEDREKRSKLIDAISAHVIKANAKPKSRKRRDLRAIPGVARLIDLPNRRIEQTLKEGLRRFHIRLRAAWVLGQKMASSEDPATQTPLRDLMLIAARTNTRYYPAFGSKNNDEDQIVNSFRQRVMVPTRPVAHLALGLQQSLLTTGREQFELFELALAAESWLAETIENSETYRVMFGDIFPSHESSYVPTRTKNYYVPPQEMIAVLPFIDRISSATDFQSLKALENFHTEQRS